MAAVIDIMAAIIGQIENTLGGTASPQVIEGLNCYPMLENNPTPPAIDIYPGSPFQESIAFGRGNKSLNFDVRARINTPDSGGAQEVLLAMVDPEGTASVEQAILSDPQLGGTVSDLFVEGPSDYGTFIEPSGAGAFMSATWRVSVTP